MGDRVVYELPDEVVHLDFQAGGPDFARRRHVDALAGPESESAVHASDRLSETGRRVLRGGIGVRKAAVPCRRLAHDVGSQPVHRKTRKRGGGGGGKEKEKGAS